MEKRILILSVLNLTINTCNAVMNGLSTLRKISLVLNIVTVGLCIWGYLYGFEEVDDEDAIDVEVSPGQTNKKTKIQFPKSDDYF